MTRQPAPHRPPVALTIAGSDSGGGAGVQADLKTMEAHGTYGTSAVTAATAQHTRGVESTHVLPVAEVGAQIDAVTGDFDVRAAKTGMLATASIVERVTEFARGFDRPLVVDPVMVAASGDRLLSEDAEDAYDDLLAAATLATPNADEAAILAGREVTDAESAIAAGETLLETGVDAALVKGGHVTGDDPDEVLDVLVTEDGVERFTHPRVDTDATHGSGCALSAAIAARLAHGEGLAEAVAAGVDFMERAVRYHHDVGAGPGAVHHLVDAREREARPSTADAVREVVDSFVAADVGPLVAEVGMNVVGATPFAEETGQCAAVDGRIARTMDGVAATRGVRFGASGHMARFLLAVREFDPDRRFACNVGFRPQVEAALADLDWETVELDRQDQPEAVAAGEGSTMQWAAREAFADGSPAVVYDRGAVGKEPMCRVTAADAATLQERVLTLLDAVEK